MGPPPAAALTLTTGLPGDSPAFPVRRTLRGCLVPRTTTEPQRNLATGTLLRPQAEAPLPAAEGPALGRSLRKRAPFPDRSGRTAPGRSHAFHSRISRVPGPLAASHRGACAIIFHNIAGRFPRLSKGQATSLPWTAAGPCGGILARFAIFTHALAPVQHNKKVS